VYTVYLVKSENEVCGGGLGRRLPRGRGGGGGNLLGALGGETALPAEWVEPLEARELIRQVATDLCQPTPIHHEDRVAWEEHARRYPYV
jgi:hypothetical protein